MSEKDQTLIRKTLAGEHDAFGDLVERYSARVRGLVLEVVRRPEEVEDLAQEVFYKAYQELASLKEPGKFAAWLGRIAVRVAVDWLRRRRVEIQAMQEADALLVRTQRPDEQMEAGEVSHVLWEALDRLAPEYRRVLVLFYLEGCAQRDIARFLGVSLTTVKWRLYKGRKMLRQDIEEMLYQEAAQQPKTTRALREKVLGCLPPVAFFQVSHAGWWTWGRRGLVLGAAGLLGWSGLEFGSALREQMRGTRTEKNGIHVSFERRDLPDRSVFWQPRQPRWGEKVRIEVAGEELGAEGEQAFLHFITNLDYPVDKTVPMQREGDSWEAELALPEGARAVFFYVSGEEESPASRHASWSPGHRKALQQYCWSLLVHDEQRRPVRDAEFMVAKKELLAGRPFREVQVHLDRETARYPDNVKAYNERWFHALKEDNTAKEWVQEEQRALMARFPDQPEVLFALDRYAGTRLPETYQELRKRFPDYERTDELAYMWAGFYRLGRDSTNHIAMLEEVIRSFPESRYVDDAYADLIDALVSADPTRAAQLADSLIDGKVSGGRSGLRSTKAETAEGRAYGVRFELFLREGDVEGALDLAERLMGSDLDDLSPFVQFGSRLSGGKCRWFAGSVTCPRDLSLATQVLEAGLPWAELESLRARLIARFASSVPESARKHVDGERARQLRGTYLKILGRCYLAQERFSEAVACLREVVELLVEMDPYWGQEEVCALLGETLEGMGDRDGAWDAYEQALAFTGVYPPAEEALERLYTERYRDRDDFQVFLRERRPLAPEFALMDVRGQRVRLSDWVGRSVLLFYKRFFSKPFDEKIVDALEEWQRRFGKELVVLYVGDGLIDPERFGTLAAKQVGGLRVALDDGSVYEGYKPGYGELFLIDGLGKLRWRRSWRGEEQEEIGRRIGEVVAEEGGERRIQEASSRLRVEESSAGTARH